MFGSRKNQQAPPQQEMVQVGMFKTPPTPEKPKAFQLSSCDILMNDRSDGSMWRSRTPDNRSPDPPKVVGASYSYTDMLKSVGTKTPPSSSSTSLPLSSMQAGSHYTPSPLADARNFDDFISQTDDDWDADFASSVTQEDDILNPARSLAKVKSIEGRPVHDSGKSREHTPKNSGSKWDYPSSKSKSKGLRPQFEGLVRDPANSLHLIYHPPISPATQTPAEIENINARISRINKFKAILQSSTVDLHKLRELSWGGIPEELRPMAWQLLLGYLPANSERRVATLERKRKEYFDGVKQAFGRGTAGMDQQIWHQISIDIPRTNPHIPLYGYEMTQRCLEKILYVWAIRHPASGYVQGINDLVTPFWQVFLSAYIEGEVETFDPGTLPHEVLDVVSADSFWCLTKLLDGIQDNYIHGQPGIQRQVASLRDLTQRIDAALAKHLSDVGVEFIQFSFRWMNCMLMREVSVKNTVRMWDTYMAEGPSGFSEFHLYVCAAFLVKWTDELKKKDFQEVMMFLQALPTQAWGEKEITLLLSEAFIWQSLFRNSTAHLRSNSANSTPTKGLQL